MRTRAKKINNKSGIRTTDAITLNFISLKFTLLMSDERKELWGVNWCVPGLETVQKVKY